MKLTKVIVASLTIPSVVVPLTTLTSCSQGWGHATPMAIGSLGNGPYSGFEQTYLDRDGNDMVGYLQDSYAVQKSSNAYYGYSAPMKFVQSEEEETPGEWKLGEVGWYTSTDSNLNPYAKDKVKDDETDSYTRTNARNAALSQNIDFVSSIGLTISSYIDMALSYSVSQVRENYNKCDLDIKTAWGGEEFNHGIKGGSTQEQNNKFYEFMFALANNLETTNGKNIAMLQTSNTNFNFVTMPLPSYQFTEGKRDLSDSFKKMLENKINWSGENKEYWTKKSKVLEEKNPKDEDKPFKYISYTYESVPIIIHTSSYTKSFVNVSRKSNSFLINDYYATDSQVTNTVGDQWKSGKRRPGLQAFTDIKDEDATPNYKEYVMESNGSPIGGCQDARLSDASIQSNDFIALVNYTVNLYDEDEGITEPHSERNSAIVNRLDYMFPAYFLELFSSDIYKDIKEGGPKIFDKKKIDKHNKDLMGILDRSSKEGQKAHARDLSNESKQLLQFLQKMFGKNTSTFLFPGQQIQK